MSKLSPALKPQQRRYLNLNSDAHTKLGLRSKLAATYLIFLELTNPIVEMTTHPLVKTGLDILAKKSELDPKLLGNTVDFLVECRGKLGDGAAHFLDRAEFGTAALSKSVAGGIEYQTDVLDRTLKKNGVGNESISRVLGVARNIDLKRPLDSLSKYLALRGAVAPSLGTRDECPNDVEVGI